MDTEVRPFTTCLNPYCMYCQYKHSIITRSLPNFYPLHGCRKERGFPNHIFQVNWVSARDFFLANSSVYFLHQSKRRAHSVRENRVCNAEQLAFRLCKDYIPYIQDFLFSSLSHWNFILYQINNIEDSCPFCPWQIPY